jgi:hypothetical protein
MAAIFTISSAKSKVNSSIIPVYDSAVFHFLSNFCHRILLSMSHICCDCLFLGLKNGIILLSVSAL